MAQMKLTDLIRRINTVDVKLIVFQEDLNNYNSDIILTKSEDHTNGIKEQNSKKYYFLTEVSVARAFLKDWKKSLTYLPSFDAMAKTLHSYSIKDV